MIRREQVTVGAARSVWKVLLSVLMTGQTNFASETRPIAVTGVATLAGLVLALLV
jgi:hypothetical protein